MIAWAAWNYPPPNPPTAGPRSDQIELAALALAPAPPPPRPPTAVGGKLVADDRPALLNALTYIRDGDLLTVQEVDRLGRNLLEGLIVLNDLFQRGVESIRTIATGVKVSIGVVHKTLTDAKAEDT
ncbi:recombinase family protein [Nonomuraea rubra]|uniref:DNA invertase Pin-like site-specific DNA recombinase n=1 Tax=Nonomuraea rubra TaxID=46180 RepID=A0A7X0NWE2_9ACTN|nr:recombinase family protein [Nonomuraea rubra]MBB6550883.1 DNA invertase Pin-like site-specific DNA recombinase [Nonomuraea rubra]